MQERERGGRGFKGKGDGVEKSPGHGRNGGHRQEAGTEALALGAAWLVALGGAERLRNAVGREARGASMGEVCFRWPGAHVA